MTSENVKKEAEEAVKTAEAYTYQEKEKYVDSMKARMVDFDRQIQELESKAEARSSTMKAQGKTAFNQAFRICAPKSRPPRKRMNG